MNMCSIWYCYIVKKSYNKRVLTSTKRRGMVFMSGSTAPDAGGEDRHKEAHNGKEQKDNGKGDPRHV